MSIKAKRGLIRWCLRVTEIRDKLIVRTANLKDITSATILSVTQVQIRLKSCDVICAFNPSTVCGVVDADASSRCPLQQLIANDVVPNCKLTHVKLRHCALAH